MNIKSKLRGWIENALIVFTGFILIFLLAGDRLMVPALLQVLGRSHPLVLHFPIVLMLVALAFMLVPGIMPEAYQKKITKWALLFALFFAGIAVLSGWVLSQEEGYEGDNLTLHKWLGVAVYFLGILMYFTMDQWPKTVKPIGLILLFLLIGAGHLGADLTHGSDFLMAPLRTEETSQVGLKDAEVFQHLVMPILEQKCLNCHQASKSKGELRLDEIAFINKGGESGALFDTTNWEKSLLVHRIMLPKEEKKHMPPKGKAQLTSEELEILRLWVKGGADFEQKVVDKGEEDPLYELASLQLKKENPYDFPEADAKDIAALNNHYRLVAPLFPGAAALEVAYFGAGAFDPASLKELATISQQVVSINLNQMPLENVPLTWLKDFEHLEDLKLNFTGVTAEQLEGLALPSLKRLSLAGNSLDPKMFEVIDSFPSLELVNLWNTGLGREAASVYKEEWTGVILEWGFVGDGAVYQLNPPEVLLDKPIAEGPQQITLKHAIGSVKLRYTLDGSEPDSASSPLYEGPITMNQTGQIKAIALAEGWKSSESALGTFYSVGVLPEGVTLKTSPAKKYAGKGKESLFDQEKGGETYTSGGWLGFKDEPLDLIMEMGGQEVNNLAISLLYQEDAYIFPPANVKISAITEGGGSWKTLLTDRPTMPTGLGKSRMDQKIYALPDGRYQKIRLQLIPLNKLPPWHRGAGDKAWVFVDEVVLD
ncbi:cytochrome C [Echinicola strongylocentroti]|uniref:Cytochrome C n=1 Tax=Echinicola strongylocentroti TaxID=1795355 RepID=A0A2Z4IEE4_9BACT|nr:chitobiase/beta-hexosaminidase C-terminal domain-containing protein [Echinicola strongylocentroti]AWW29215.1 cytochrome C [Echinicola strongylocentroti]